MDSSTIIYRFLQALPAIIGIYGIYEFFTAARTRDKVGGALMAIGALAIYGGVMFYTDYSAVSKASDELEECRRHVVAVAEGIERFKAKHDGKLPRTLYILYQSEQIPVCPVHANDPGAGYRYRIPRRPGPTQMLLWDRKPHVFEYKYLKFKSSKYRNILLMDGTVLTLEENEIPIMSLD